MIIQCAQCSSKFRLDDAKVTEAGIKVRCSKCKHIFVVKKEAAGEEADLDLLLQGLQPAAGAAAGTAAAEPSREEPTVTPESSSFEPAPSFESTPSFEPAEDQAAAGETPSPEEPSFSAEAPAEPPPTAFEEDFSFAAADEGPSSAAEEVASAEVAPSAAGEFDFGSVAPEEPVAAAPDREISFASAEPPESPAAEEFSFGEVSPEAFAAATVPSSTAEPATPELTFEFEADETPETVPAQAPTAAAEEPLDFGEIDFGIDEGAPTAAGKDGPAAAPDREAVPPPIAAAAVEREEVVVPPVAVPFGDDELPPLTISSRRKGQSLLPAVVISVSVLIIVLLAGAGFYFFKEGPEALNKLGIGFVGSWLGMENKEEGQIGLDKVRGCYFTNAEAGEVFVIRGEAINNFRKARASIQVKGALLGANAQVLAQKVAFCGNNLTDEQIKSLPMAKIDAAMNNQFGDSLANLGVQPGKRIPFVIVLANIPKDATDYSVEVVGSTVASQ